MFLPQIGCMLVIMNEVAKGRGDLAASFNCGKIGIEADTALRICTVTVGVARLLGLRLRIEG